MSEPQGIVIGALIGLAGGLIAAIVTLIVSRSQLRQERSLADQARLDACEARRDAKHERDRASQERQDERREQHLFDALQYFTGDTQPRGVGISVVEGFLEKVPELRSTLMPLLINQALYLLKESGQVTKSHEQDNLRRIMTLIVVYKADPGVTCDFTTLLTTIDARLEEANERKELIDQGKVNDLRGVEVDQNVLTTWKSGLTVSSRRAVDQPPVSCVRFNYQES